MDLRDFIDRLSEHGLLTQIDREVEYLLEIGQLTRERQVPLLFNHVKGYPEWRVFTNGLSSCSLVGIALGLQPGGTRREISQLLRSRMASPRVACLVSDGPVMQNIQSTGIDLARLPIPHWHPSDAGRYLGTWHINVTKDPENGSRNVGVYRMQLLDSLHATVCTSMASDLGRHVAKAERLGRPLPMAVAVGVSEATVMAAASGVAGVDEFELASTLQGESLKLVKCQTIDLEVPANAELVVEGFIRSCERVQDGPYFDYAGEPNTCRDAFVFEATGLMYRNKPIFRGSSIGQAGAEDHQLFAVLADLGLFDFHGNHLRRFVQSVLLQTRQFKFFQIVGRFGNPFRRRQAQR